MYHFLFHSFFLTFVLLSKDHRHSSDLQCQLLVFKHSYYMEHKSLNDGNGHLKVQSQLHHDNGLMPLTWQWSHELKWISPWLRIADVIMHRALQALYITTSCCESWQTVVTCKAMIEWTKGIAKVIGNLCPLLLLSLVLYSTHTNPHTQRKSNVFT